MPYPTWSLALSYQQDFTVIYFLAKYFLLQQHTQGLMPDHLEWNIYRWLHLCHVQSYPNIMRNCKYTLNIQKYPMQSSINALCTLHIYTDGCCEAGEACPVFILRHFFIYTKSIQNCEYKCIKGRAENICNLRQKPRLTLIDQWHKIFWWALIM